MHERETDTDFWAKLGWIVDHFKIAWAFWLIVASCAGWFAKKVIDPLEEIPHIKSQQDSLFIQLRAAETDRQDMKNVLKIVVKMQCLATDAVDRYKYGIDCASIPTPSIRSLPTLMDQPATRR